MTILVLRWSRISDDERWLLRHVGNIVGLVDYLLLDNLLLVLQYLLPSLLQWRGALEVGRPAILKLHQHPVLRLAGCLALSCRQQEYVGIRLSCVGIAAQGYAFAFLPSCSLFFIFLLIAKV